MSNLNVLVKDFLAQKKIAVVGVNPTRQTGCNSNYHTFKKAGYTVFPINPHITEFEGSPCYPDLRALPEKPDGVFILANPKVTDQIVDQCVELGIPRVWMHCLMGTKPGAAANTTSVSQDAVAKCRANGIRVIPGSCPNQFIGDIGHGMMRVFWSVLGYMK